MIKDLALIKEVKVKNCTKSFRELTDRYENIFFNIVHNKTFGMSNVDKQHLLDQKDWLFLHCIKKYDPAKKAKFSTMIGNYARYMCLNYAKKHHHHFIEFEKISDKDLEKEEIKFDKQDVKDIMDLIETYEDPRISKIFGYRYDFQKGTINNWKSVSKKLKESDEVVLSDQGCINIHNKVIKQIKNNLTREK